MTTSINGMPFSDARITSLTLTGTLGIDGDGRVDLSDATVLATNTDGGVLKAGTSSARVTEDTAGMKFISLYFDDGATSGTAQGIYDRLYITGAGGSGDALRAFCTVEDVAAVNARGAHISLSFGDSGTVTGSGQALTTTLHIPDDASQSGHLSAITAEIYADGDTSDPAGSTLSLMRFSTAGGAGTDDIDDDCAAFHWDSGFTDGSGNMLYDPTVRVRVGANTTRYLFLSSAEGNLTFPASDARLDLSSCTVAAANTDGGLIRAGTSVAPVTEDTASMKFLSYYFDDGATSGTAVGEYVKLSVTGAGGSGVAMRPYGVVDTVAGATIHTVQATLGFAGGGTLTGAGNAIYANVMLPTEAVTGTLSAMTAEIFSENTASDPAGSLLSIFRVANSGDADGKTNVDDDCFLFNFDGWGVGDGNMIAVKAAGACPNVTHSIRLRMPDGSAAYLYAGATPLTA